MFSKQIVRRSLRAGLVAGFALVMVGCTTVRGGGWVTSATGTGKATFGFQLVCNGDETTTAQVSGQLQYHDPGANVRLHGQADAVPFSTCTNNGVEGRFFGRYTPQPQSRGPGGEFEIVAQDLGERGPSKGDTFQITLTGGVYDGYTNEGVVGGGNIQAK